MVGASDAKRTGTIPDFHRVQMLGVGGCSWYGDIVGGGVSQLERTSIWLRILEMEGRKLLLSRVLCTGLSPFYIWIF